MALQQYSHGLFREGYWTDATVVSLLALIGCDMDSTFVVVNTSSYLIHPTCLLRLSKLSRFPLLLLLLCGIVASVSCAAARERVSFNDAWRFDRYGPMPDGSERPEPPGIEGAKVNDSEWRELDLPHDWAIEGPFRAELPNRTGKLPWNGIGWYRKTFSLPRSDIGKRVYVDFDGAMSQAQIWLNGEFVGEWPNGYASFRLDLTPYLKFGKDNVIAVRLENKLYSSRWYPGAGIYRNVWLVKVDPVHVAHWGVFVTTPEVSKEQAVVEARTVLENETGRFVEVEISQELYRRDEPLRIVARSPERSIKIEAGKSVENLDTIVIDQPRLWDVENPNLYTLATTIRRDGKVIDRVENDFGIRSIEWTANQGFRLNGSRVQLQGVCMHHDLGALGAAVNFRAMERQLEILRKMGVNAIRTSHNPPAPEWMDLCDRMGFLVVAEMFDVWERAKVPNDYHRFFPEWHERDVVNFVRRDRNHPSVIIWSSGNEVKEQDIGAEGLAVAQRLQAIFKREDPTRLVTIGNNRDKPVDSGFYKGMDVIGTNYRPHFHARNHELAPDYPIMTSEASSTTSSRGVYFFPVEEGFRDGSYQFHVSSYDFYGPPWRTIPETEFQEMDKNPFVIGQFVWTGFDYLGEPTPYNNDASNLLNFESEEEKKAMQAEMDKLGGMPPPRSSYFGIVDLAGFPKDRYYFYQSQWRPELPMAHILPHWTWPEREGKVTPVHLYTSGDEAELFLNGKSLGRRKKGPDAYRLRWDDVVYQPGELKAVVYKEGKEWATDVQRTTGAPSRVRLEPDRSLLQADGQDLSFITTRIEDESGLLVPRSSNRIVFTITGPADLVAVDNGDQTSHESFQASSVPAFNGLCLAVLRTREGETGTVTVTATGEGIKEDTVVLQVVK